MRSLIALALVSAGPSAFADPTTTWTTPTLATGERFAGQVPAPQGSGVVDEPPRKWVSPSGHAVMLAPMWTKERVVVRAYWSGPKPRTQDVVVIPGPVTYMDNPFYTDHSDGQLAMTVGGGIGGRKITFAYRLKFDPKAGFKVVKKATYEKFSDSPEWLQGKFEISNPRRTQMFGTDLRLHASLHHQMTSRPVTVVTRTGKTGAPTEETLEGQALVKKWDAAGQRPAMGFAAKCAKDDCCSVDGKKLAAWLHVERVCYTDNKISKLFLVAPAK